MQRTLPIDADEALWIPLILKSTLKDGLALLWRAFQYARHLGTDVWDFAVERAELCDRGLSTVDLRWLIASGYVEYAQEHGGAQTVKRSFHAGVSFLAKRVGFVLTEAGAALALETFSKLSPAQESPGREPGKPAPPVWAPGVAGKDVPAANGELSGQRPRWDPARKELRFGAQVIKQFRWTALNQETVLMAFEEDGWPRRIDDPLPPRPDQDPKRRLHDTIKCLNRNHRTRLVRFSGDGTGEGVLWSFLDGHDLDG